VPKYRSTRTPSSVSYKNQPAIDKLKGRVPLAGSGHLYTVKKVLWHKEIECFLEGLLLPRTLHACCGLSQLGDVRLDNDPDAQPDILADARTWMLEQPENSFETVLCDPPYSFRFRENHDLLAGLCHIASQRIVFQQWWIPANKYGLYKKAMSKFELTALYAWQPQTYFGRANIISVFDRRPSCIGGSEEDQDPEEPLDG